MSGSLTSSEIAAEQGEPDRQALTIAAKISHILQIYPQISYSMLQIGLGPTCPAKQWRPVLDEMIAEHIVQVDTVNLITPTGRSQSYSILSLTEAKN